MMERRTFLASMTATCLSGPFLAGQVDASTADAGGTNERLRWECDVIESVAHRSDRRKPVVTGVDVNSTGNLMAVVGDDHAVGMYDFREGSFVQHLDQHTDWVRTARFSKDGSLLATAGNDRQLFVWDATDLGAGDSLPMLQGRNPEAIIDLAFSPDGSRLATVGFESSLRLFDAQTGEQTSDLKCKCSDNHTVAFSADGQWVAAGGRSGHVCVWDVQTGNKVRCYKAHRQRVRSLEFTENGLLVSGGDDQKVAVTDPQKATASRLLPRHPSKLYAVKLLPDGVIAMGGSDNKIHLARLRDGSPVGYLEGHTGTVSSLAVKGDQLVSGGFDTQVRVWSPTREASVTGQQRPMLNTGWNN